MSVDLPALRAALARNDRVARVVVADAQGSVPREAGASMLVWEAGQSGTIGGGALEFEAARAARRILSGARAPGLSRHPLGPALGQCCGGAVTLLTEVIDAATLDRIEEAGALWARPAEAGALPPLALERYRAALAQGTETARPRLLDGWMVEPVRPAQHLLWLHGAGHVGRAIVHTLAPLPDWAITWVDTAADRFPAHVPHGVDILVAADPARAVRHAPEEAHHLILTYSHALDLALCDAVLQRGCASAGLIGSATKWARFSKRLAAGGHSPAAIARITCPIGERGLGKHPHAIAIGVVASLIRASTTAADAGLEQLA